MRPKMNIKIRNKEILVVHTGLNYPNVPEEFINTLRLCREFLMVRHGKHITVRQIRRNDKLTAYRIYVDGIDLHWTDRNYIKRRHLMRYFRIYHKKEKRNVRRT